MMESRPFYWFTAIIQFLKEFYLTFKKIKLLIAALALGGTVAAAPVAHAETLTVGTTAQTYPTSYKGDKLTGFDVAVAKAVAKEMGDK